MKYTHQHIPFFVSAVILLSSCNSDESTLPDDVESNQSLPNVTAPANSDNALDLAASTTGAGSSVVPATQTLDDDITTANIEAVPEATPNAIASSEAAEPENVEPETSAPENVEPETSAPENIEPETSAPENFEPENVAPETNAPENAEPENVEPPVVEEPEPLPPSWNVRRILDSTPTSTGQRHTQQTPIDTKDGYVYVVGIESGPNGDGDGIRQTTTIKQGNKNDNGDWQWKNATISDNTIYNTWHTPPSVGVDRNGFIHVTYNMHNSPWQYVVSEQAQNIDSFSFKGQQVSNEQFAELEFDNLTNFESLGTASLVGSQITYPAFFKKSDGELFISYRAAAKPARDFWERTMSGIIASYNEELKQWQSIGALVDLREDDVIETPGSHSSINALASETGWTVYHPKLDFSSTGDLHVMWFWRPGVAGAQSNRPCYATSSDRSNFYTINQDYLALPVTSSACGNVGYDNEQSFFTIADMKVDKNNNPHILVSPVNNPRVLLRFDKNNSNWIREASPEDASHIFFDKNGRQWALAEGLKLFYRDNIDQAWSLHYETDHNDCFPKMVWNEDQTKAYIHTQDCQSKSASVYELSLTE